MKFVVVAHRRSETNIALAGAAASLGLPASVLPPRDALRILEPSDVALGRLDVREGLDGIETGTEELGRLVEAGVDVLNPPSALVAAHDKLLTARALRHAGLPHPSTWLIADGCPSPAPELPVVLKFEDALDELARRSWFGDHGVLAQELVPPVGWDLRIVVAGDRVVGAARRVAGPGEWRTNVSLGGRSEPAAPPPLARALALQAAAAVRGDLVGVDLLPTPAAFVISEINGAVDFRPGYAVDFEDVYMNTVLQLLRAAHARRAAA